MKLPWVSRDAFDMACQLRDAERKISEDLGHTVLDLTAQVTALRVENAALHVKADANEQQANVQRERSKLTQAIRDNARGPDGTIDRRLVGHFRSKANELLNAGKTVDEAVESLSQWQTTEHDHALTADRMADFADAEPV